MILDAALTVLGGLGGYAARLAPEVLRFFDRKNERGHELAMLDKQIEADKLRGAQQLAIAQAEAASARETGELQAWVAAIQAQGKPTGIPFVDAVSALIRPFLTLYWCVFMYSVALWSQFATLKGQGLADTAAFLALWGSDERAICAGMIAYWFADRSLKRQPVAP